MRSCIAKRSIVIDGVRTSVSLEDPFWRDLKQIAGASDHTLAQLVSLIKSSRAERSNLSSAIRVYVLSYWRGRLGALCERPAPPALVSRAEMREADRVA